MKVLLALQTRCGLIGSATSYSSTPAITVIDVLGLPEHVTVATAGVELGSAEGDAAGDGVTCWVGVGLNAGDTWPTGVAACPHPIRKAEVNASPAQRNQLMLQPKRPRPQIVMGLGKMSHLDLRRGLAPPVSSTTSGACPLVYLPPFSWTLCSANP